ncbi:MAG: hypothetical protein IKZ87_00075, partial [Actinomycetaceae bacterium]|nr:hypothetical protein [Actinomycetaceae bacterium]
MNKQSDDFRAYLGSLFDPDSAPENTPENKKTQATKNTVSDKEQTQASAHEHPHEETVTDIHDTGETADLLDLLADESEQGAAEEALSPDEASLTTEELFQQAAQEAQARRREKEAKKRKEEAKEAAAWLRDTVRDESADSSQGFDFLDTEKEQGIPLPDEWP